MPCTIRRTAASVSRFMILLAVLWTSAATAPGEQITTRWQITIDTQLDLATHTLQSITVPDNFIFELTTKNAVEHPGTLQGTRILTTFERTFSDDPVAMSQLADIARSTNPFAISNPSSELNITRMTGFTNDTDSHFREHAGFISGSYFNNVGDELRWSHDVQLFLSLNSPSRGGTGAASFSFTEQYLKEYLEDAKANPGAFETFYRENWQIRDPSTSPQRTIAGVQWQGTATLLDFTVVPEPSSLSLAVLGTIGFVAGLRPKRGRRRGSKAGKLRDSRIRNHHNPVYSKPPGSDKTG